MDALGVTGAGISMVTKIGHHGVVHATDETAAQLEDLQLTLGEGPSIDAVMSGAPVLIPDLSESDIVVERWPAFMKGAAEAGVRAVFAFPLRIGAISVGALDLYRDKPGELAAQIPEALMAADAAALALLQLESTWDESFGEDMDARTSHQLQVHQATGMVQVQLGVTTGDAFLMLRARAFADGRPLVEVARDVVERRLRFSKEET